MSFQIPNSADVPQTAQYGNGAMAREYSSDVAILAAAHAGTLVTVGSCAVTAGTNAGTVKVAAGTGSWGGGTYASVSAQDNIACCSNADATNPKWILYELDPSQILQVNLGTAAVNPVPPTPTAGRVVVAAVFVPANATAVDLLVSTGNGNAKILDKRVESRVVTFDTSGNVTVTGTLTAPVSLASSNLGTKTAAFTVVDVANAATATVATNGIPIKYVNITPAVTLSVLLGSVNGIVLAPTITTTTSVVTDGYLGFVDNATFQPTTGSANVFASVPVSFVASPTLKTQDAQNQTLTGYTAFRSRPTITSGGATFTISSLIQFDAGNFTIPANCTLTALTQFRANGPTITGTLGTWIGLDIPSVTGATTNIGIRSGSSILVNAAVGIGYAAGAGGAVTQLTSKTTAFPTISKSCGTLTWNNAALGANTSATTASSTNTVIAATDVVIFNHISGGTLGAYTMTCTPAAGSWTLTLRNVSSGSLSEAPVFAFAIIKAATT